MTPPRFDLLAPHYRWMEAISFGRRLHQCRVAMLDRMTTRRRALVLGDGDGRFLAELIRVNSEVRVDAIDGSPAMIAAARQRVRMIPSGIERVNFVTADARTVPLLADHYDLIVTHFFLDCFPQRQLVALVGRIAASLAPGGEWVVSDFRVPETQPARLFSQIALLGMYTFFRCVSGLSAGRLVDPAPLLRECGLQPIADWRALGGFLACTAWAKPGAGSL